MGSVTDGPAIVTGLCRAAGRLFRFVPPEPLQYWAVRARQSGNQAVMWTNPRYNTLVDADQWKMISGLLPTRREHVLDLGCGTGRLTERLGTTFNRYTGIDIEEMIQQARKSWPDQRFKFEIAKIGTCDFPKVEFDMVLTVACLSCGSCDAAGFGPLLKQIRSSLAMGGRLIMIEPLHRYPLLARQLRFSAAEVVALARTCGMRLKVRRPLYFWPFRLILTRAVCARWPRMTEIAYRIGECLLRLLPGCFGDYWLLVFDKTDPDSIDVPERAAAATTSACSKWR